jgi:hypothetical protein
MATHREPKVLRGRVERQKLPLAAGSNCRIAQAKSASAAATEIDLQDCKTSTNVSNRKELTAGELSADCRTSRWLTVTACQLPDRR